MEKGILEFTLNGHKHTFLRRIDVFGKPVTTKNKHDAKQIKKKELKTITEKLILQFGIDNINNLNFIINQEKDNK